MTLMPNALVGRKLFSLWENYSTKFLSLNLSFEILKSVECERRLKTKSAMGAAGLAIHSYFR